MRIISSVILCLIWVLGFTQKPADFIFTDIHGIQHSLYGELAKGKTVVLDFFFVDCKPCQRFTPMVEDMYQDYGGDTGNVVVFGISDRDDNAAVKGFETKYEVTYPSCGYEGGGDTITDYYRLNYTFLGWPTYAVVCSDTSIYWNLAKADSLPSIRDSIAQCPMSGNAGIPGLVKSNSNIWYAQLKNQIEIINVNSTVFTTVAIRNELGQEVIARKRFSKSLTINTQYINSGIYFVTTISKFGVSTQKIFIKN
ncbi:MAG: thiol-disulfide isomerase/thioredoxin [Crocinitomix sp.]|jgi:thiol-disulfide isomerase/thioredoxin